MAATGRSVCVCVHRGVWLQITVRWRGRRYWGGRKHSSPSGYRKLGQSLWICLSLLSNTELVVTQHKEWEIGRGEGERAWGGVWTTEKEREKREKEAKWKGNMVHCKVKGDWPRQSACSRMTSTQQHHLSTLQSTQNKKTSLSPAEQVGIQRDPDLKRLNHDGSSWNKSEEMCTSSCRAAVSKSCSSDSEQPEWC